MGLYQYVQPLFAISIRKDQIIMKNDMLEVGKIVNTHGLRGGQGRAVDGCGGGF